jgi:DNA primase
VVGLRIPEEKVQEIRERADLLQVVGERVVLKKAGARYTGLCPFHQEKSPSFTVHPGMGIFHCFGCGTGGDVISFLMKIEGRPFVEVVRDLAARFGVSLPERAGTPAEREAEAAVSREREALLRANAQAMAFYHGLLLRDSGARAARDYLSSRGISDETLRRYKLGYAPDAWDVLSSFFARGGTDMGLATRAGLVAPRERATGHYDRFRNRLLFPILGVNGEVLGFGGRQLADGDGAKYLNSPETPLFHKGKCLFGLHGAAPAIRQGGSAIVVEGYFDQVALVQAGVENVVATLGTALTEDHVRILKRLSRAVYVLFDGDEAGVRAAQKSADALLREGLTVRVVELPRGDDPDSFVLREGVEAFRARVAQAKPILDFVIDSSAARVDGTIAGKARCVEALRPLFVYLQSPVERALYVTRIADRLRIPEPAVEEALGVRRASPLPASPAPHSSGPRARFHEGRGGPRGSGHPGRAPATSEPPPSVRAARDALPPPIVQLVALVLAHPSLAAEAAADDAVLDDAPDARAVVRAAASAHEQTGRVDVAALLDTVADETLRRQILARTLSVSEEEEPGATAQDIEARNRRALCELLRALRERHLRDDAARLQRALAEAVAAGDTGLVARLSHERMDLERKIRGLAARDGLAAPHGSC